MADRRSPLERMIDERRCVMEHSEIMRDWVKRAGTVSHEEAREIATRYNASHFGIPGAEKARYSIPANPQRDDDIRLRVYIAQQEAKDAERDRLILALHDAIARPLGVVPRSAEPWYDPKLAYAARWAGIGNILDTPASERK